jgi:anti-anti-sigma factor
MASIEFRVKVIKSPSGTTATLAEIDGSIDATTIQQFQQVMDKLIERGVKNLILDCTSVKYINSTGLGTLLKYADTFESMSGHIAFCRVPSKVMLVMEMLGFNALFNIVPDEATALRSFSGVAAPPSSVPVKMEAPPPQPAPPPTSPATFAAPAPQAPAAYAPAAAAPTFPMQSTCARCRVTLDIPNVGKYKCPRCGAILAVEPTGRVRFFASKKSQPIEIAVPCNKDLLPGVGQLVGTCAQALGFPGNTSQTVAQAVNTACGNVVDLAYGGDPSGVFHVLVIPNGKTLTINIADHGKPFDFGPGGSIYADQRFAGVVGAMDTVEHRVNPRGGNLLTFIKVLQ